MKENTSKVTVSEETVDLATAQKLLATRAPDKSRRIRPGKVDQYARDMLTSNWHVNGETGPNINELGEMVEGRHRMMAVVKAATEGSGEIPANPQIQVRFLVARGIKADVAVEDTINTGMSRFWRDVLAIRGIPNAALMAATTRKYWSWENGMYIAVAGMSSGVVATFSELDRFYEKNEEKIAAGVTYSSVNYEGARLAPTVLAVAYIILHDKDAAAADEFLEGVVNGTSLLRTSPIWVLRRRYQRFDDQNMYKGRGRIGQANRLALLISAWNHWRDGSPHGNLPLPPGGVSNRNFPIPR